MTSDRDSLYAELLIELRALYARQHLTEEEGGAEVALWYWREDLERIMGASLIDFDNPTQWLERDG